MKKAAISVSALLFAGLVSAACTDNRPILQVRNKDGGGETAGNDGPATPDCPAGPPLGLACSSPDQLCRYGYNVPLCGGRTVICKSGQWIEESHSDPQTGCNPDAGPQGLTAPQSFVVHLHFAWRDANGPIDLPDLSPDQTATLRVDPTSSTLTLGFSSVTIQNDQGITFKAVAGFSVEVGQTLCGAAVTYDQFSVTVTGDSIAGAGQGHLLLFRGDQGITYQAQATLTGTRDTTIPTLSGNVTNVDPLAGLTLKASEPLSPLVTARLTAGADVVEGQPFKINSDPAGMGAAALPVVGFTFSPPALRFGTTYDLAVQPWTDLAGNAGAALPKVVTRAVPPLAPEDGFESAGTTLGGTAVVKADVLPAISGQQSLLVNVNVQGVRSVVPSASNHLTLRLAVAPGDRFVRFSVRPLGEFQNGASTQGTSFRVAVPGVAINAATLPSSETLTAMVPIGTAGATAWMGSVRTVEIPLPAGASNEVVFDVTMTGGFLCGLPSPTAAYLIDDLRVE